MAINICQKSSKPNPIEVELGKFWVTGMPPKKWTELLSDAEKIFSEAADLPAGKKPTEGELYSKANPIYTTLMLQLPLTPAEKFKVLSSLFRNLPRDGLEMLIRIRDMIGFLSNQKLIQETVQLLRMVACDLVLAGDHERVFTALTLYNKSFLDEAFSAFSKIAGEPGVGWAYRTECCRYLFSTGDEAKIEFAQECLLEVIRPSSTPTPDSSTRYDIINSFISDKGFRSVLNWKKIPVVYDETFVYGLQASFFSCLENGVRERILSGAHILSMSDATVGVKEKDDVVGVLLGIASSSTYEANVRGDAADAVCNGGNRSQRIEAKKILRELGFSGVDRNSKFITSRARTIYNNEQNVHDESIAESIIRFIEIMVSSDDIGNATYSTVNEEIVGLINEKITVKSDKIKALGALKRVERDTTTFSSYKTTIAEILVHVWLRVKSYESEPEVMATLKQRLLEELLEMGETCSSGHCARFINVLSSVDPQISISFESQIVANLAGRINARIRNIPDAELADQINTGMMEDSEPEDRQAYLRFVANAISEIELEMRKEFVGDKYISSSEFDEFFAEAKKEWQ